MKAACGRTRRLPGLVVWAEPGKLLFVKPGKMFRCSTGPRVHTAFTVCVATPRPSHSQIQPERLTAAILLITVVLKIHHVFMERNELPVQENPPKDDFRKNSFPIRDGTKPSARFKAKGGAWTWKLQTWSFPTRLIAAGKCKVQPRGAPSAFLRPAAGEGAPHPHSSSLSAGRTALLIGVRGGNIPGHRSGGRTASRPGSPHQCVKLPRMHTDSHKTTHNVTGTFC